MQQAQLDNAAIEALRGRKRELGMSYPALAWRAGLSLASVKYLLSAEAGSVALVHFEKIAEALGLSHALPQLFDVEDFCFSQASKKAERIVRMVQATCGLEGQAVEPRAYQKMLERTVDELLAGPRRRLWNQ